MKKFPLIVVAAFLLSLGAISLGTCAATLELLTREEAALPEARSFGFSTSLRSDGPAIRVKDVEVGEGQPSFPLEVGFATRAGGAVDLATLKMECLKSTTIDLTPRIKPYATTEGVRIANVSLPPGLYRFRVAIGDVNGRMSEKDFTVKVSVKF